MKFCIFVLLLWACSCTPTLVADQLQNIQSTTSESTNSETTPPDDPNLHIVVLNIGQGDATLIFGPRENGTRQTILIDAGPLNENSNQVILDTLSHYNVETINHLILTHYDSDHMGALVTANESLSLLWGLNCQPTSYFPTNSIIDLGSSNKNTATVQEYLNCRDSILKDSATQHIIAGQSSLGTTIDLNLGFELTLVTANGYVIDQQERVPLTNTDNEKSISILISGPGGFNYLSTGDLTGQAFGNEDAEAERILADALQNRNIDLDILRVGHHGAANASSNYFIETLEPKWGIISVGENSHGHVACETLETLVDHSVSVIQTNAGSPNESCPEQDLTIITEASVEVIVSEQGEYVITALP